MAADIQNVNFELASGSCSDVVQSKLQRQTQLFQGALERFLDNKDTLAQELVLQQQRFMEIFAEQRSRLRLLEETAQLDESIPPERAAIIDVKPAADDTPVIKKVSVQSDPGETQDKPSLVVEHMDSKIVRSSHGSNGSEADELPMPEIKEPQRSPRGRGSVLGVRIPRFSFRERKANDSKSRLRKITSVAKLPSHWRTLVKKRSFQESSLRHWETKFTRSKEYEVFMGFVISLNALYIGFDLQHDGTNHGNDRFDENQVGALSFVSIYLLDLSIRFRLEGMQYFCGRDHRWNQFDFVIVLVSLLDLCVYYAMSGEYSNIRIEWLRTIRLLRLVRVFHVTRFLKIFREFRLLMFSVQKSLGAFFWVLVVCGLTVYLFAIVLAQASLDYCNPSKSQDITCQQFGKLSDATLNLYKAMFGGLSWGELFESAKPLGDMFPVVILLFISFSSVIIMNLVTGVVLDILREIANTEKEIVIRDTLRQKREYAKKMQDVFDELDVNSSGGISLEEFKYAIREPRMSALLDSLGLDFGDVADVFDLLDRNKTGAVDVEEFVLGCMRIKGGARTLDLMKLQQHSENIMTSITDLHHRVDALQSFNASQGLGRAGGRNSVKSIRPSVFSAVVDTAMVAHSSTMPVSRLPDDFQRRHRIDLVEERAMNVRELQSVLLVVRQQYAVEEWINRVNGERLDPEDVNLYHFDHNCISPRTIPDGVILCGLQVEQGGCSAGQAIIQRSRDCETAVLAEGLVRGISGEGKIHVTVTRGRFMVDAVTGFADTCILVDGLDVGTPSDIDVPISFSYKELISQAPTRPKWFCSHWWGEPISDFVNCCESHTQLRGMTELESSYWICAYANRQHELASDISNDPDNSSFKKAMNAARGVLLVLDSDATPFKRIWCDFELYNTIADGKPLDIVTGHDENGLRLPQLLSQGLLPGETMFNKTRREANFPLTLLACGLHCRLEDGDATVQVDKDHILRFMAMDYKKRKSSKKGEVIDGDALANALEHANSTLHSYLAIAAWPQAVRKRRVENFDVTKPGTLNLPSIIARDQWKKEFHLSLAHLTEVTDAEMSRIGEGLPRNLTKLQLSFEGCLGISDDGVLSLMQHFPSGVQTLHLDFLGCRGITDQGLKHLAMRLPESLRELRLDFAACERIGVSGITALRENIPKKLERFAATFQGTEIDRKFKSVSELKRYVVVALPLKNTFNSMSAKLKKTSPGI